MSSLFFSASMGGSRRTWSWVCSAISWPLLHRSLTRRQYGSVSFLMANLRYRQRYRRRHRRRQGPVGAVPQQAGGANGFVCVCVCVCAQSGAFSGGHVGVRGAGGQLAAGDSWRQWPVGERLGAPGKGDVAAVGVLATANRLHHCVIDLGSDAVIVLQAAGRQQAGVVSTQLVWGGGAQEGKPPAAGNSGDTHTLASAGSGEPCCAK